MELDPASTSLFGLVLLVAGFAAGYLTAALRRDPKKSLAALVNLFDAIWDNEHVRARLPAALKDRSRLRDALDAIWSAAKANGPKYVKEIEKWWDEPDRPDPSDHPPKKKLKKKKNDDDKTDDEDPEPEEE